MSIISFMIFRDGLGPKPDPGLARSQGFLRKGPSLAWARVQKPGVFKGFLEYDIGIILGKV